MAGLSKLSPERRPRPVMNVTPLVDITLVLLIIFMVVIPALDQGLLLEVPTILHPDEEKKSKVDPFLLSIARDGSFHFEERRVAPENMERVLREASKREPSRRVVIRADREIGYGRVRHLYATVQSVGFPGVSLRVNHRKPGQSDSSAERTERTPGGTGSARWASAEGQ